MDTSTAEVPFPGPPKPRAPNRAQRRRARAIRRRIERIARKVKAGRSVSAAERRFLADLGINPDSKPNPEDA